MQLTPRSMENAAVFYLRRFPASSAHLRRVLARKARRAPNPDNLDEAGVRDLIDSTVSAMERAGLVDDARYARGLADSLLHNNRPLRRIEAELARKLVPRELIQETMDGLKERVSPESDLEAARAVARRKRLGPFRRNPEERIEKRQRDLAAMARSGFSYDIAKKVIDAELESDTSSDL